MRGHIKLFTLNMAPHKAQQTARAKMAENGNVCLGRTGNAFSERILLQAPQ